MKKNICVIMMLIVFVFMTGCSAKDIQAIYDDNQRISSTSNTYNLINSNSEIKGQQITGEFEKMEGMDTVWTYQAEEDMELEMTYLLNITKGKMKFVLISPDDSITNIVEMTKDSPVKDYAVSNLKIKKGKNRIKLVGGVDTSSSFEIKIPEGDFEELGQ